MIVQCTCGLQLYVKEPFDDNSVSHGICAACHLAILRELEEFKAGPPDHVLREE